MNAIVSEYDYTGTVIDGYVLGNPYIREGKYVWSAPFDGFINEFGQIEVTSTW